MSVTDDKTLDALFILKIPSFLYAAFPYNSKSKGLGALSMRPGDELFPSLQREE